MEQGPTKYVIFRTKWGYFGLAGTETTLHRTCLPVPSADMAKRTLTRRGLTTLLRCDRTYFADLQKEITSYFEGSYVRFDKDIPVSLAGTSKFGRAVLTALRDVTFGETISYGRLARRAGRTGAARAVGAVMSKNPLPLIIGCHRVICNNGSLGGFSAPGGVTLKKKLLAHEQNASATSRKLPESVAFTFSKVCTPIRPDSPSHQPHTHLLPRYKSSTPSSSPS